MSHDATIADDVPREIIDDLRRDARDHGPFSSPESRLAAVCALVDIRALDAGAVATPSASDWEEPTELPGLSDVPAWNHRLLPEALRALVADVCERIQCPADFVGVAVMVSLASVIGRGCAIRPKRHDDWTVIANLWAMAVGLSSAMKSPAIAEAIKALARIAADAARLHAEGADDRDALAAKAEAVKVRMRKAAEKQEDLASHVDELRAARKALAEASAERRFVVNDSTIEKLAVILAASPRGVLVLRDELMGWFSQLDRQGHEQDRAFFLECFNGDGSFRVDRMTRESVHVDAACVSILGGIQPGPLAAYLRSADAGGVGADGLMQRFQLAVFPDRPSTWTNVDRKPDAAARASADAVFRRLAYATPEDLRADASDGLPFLRFDNEAQEFADDWRTALHRRLLASEESPAMDSHLAKFPALMPSLALICHLADVGHGPVGLESAKRAAAWCAYLESHARRLYSAARSGPDSSASLLLTKIKSGKLASPFTDRTVYNAHWSGLATPDDVRGAVDALESHGWVRRVSVQTTGRSRTEIHVHPSITGGT